MCAWKPVTAREATSGKHNHWLWRCLPKLKDFYPHLRWSPMLLARGQRTPPHFSKTEGHLTRVIHSEEWNMWENRGTLKVIDQHQRKKMTYSRPTSQSKVVTDFRKGRTKCTRYSFGQTKRNVTSKASHSAKQMDTKRRWYNLNPCRDSERERERLMQRERERERERERWERERWER